MEGSQIASLLYITSLIISPYLVNKEDGQDSG